MDDQPEKARETLLRVLAGYIEEEYHLMQPEKPNFETCVDEAAAHRAMFQRLTPARTMALATRLLEWFGSSIEVLIDEDIMTGKEQLQTICNVIFPAVKDEDKPKTDVEDGDLPF